MLDHIKYVPFSRDGWYLSMGGEIRQRYENYQNPGFGSDPKDDNGYLLQRYLLHADSHFGSRFRLFVQLQSGIENGRNGGPRLTDEDIIDLHQAFGDLILFKGAHSQLTLRVGRQEIEFGSGRLIGASEGLNLRRAFDGGRVTYKLGRWTFNSTLLRPVLLKRDAFDDVPDHTQLEWGAGGLRPRANNKGSVAFYYFGLDKKTAFFGPQRGRELRHTFGNRWWGSVGALDYDSEFIGQFGRFNGQDIVAGATSHELGWNWREAPLKPRLGGKFDLVSGGSSPGTTLNTFNALFPNPVYAGRNALLGPANLSDAGPNVRLALGKKSNVTLDSPVYWRTSTHDGLYSFAGIPIRPGNRSNARYIGIQPGLQAEYRFSPHITANIAYSHFFVGRFFRETPPGKSVDYTVGSIAYKF